MSANETQSLGLGVDCSRPVSVQYSSKYSIEQSLKQYEDYCVAHPSLKGHQQDIEVYAIFDGHKGASVSQFLAEHLVKQLEPRLSGVHPRLEQLCDEAYADADTIRRAVTAAFLDLAITVQQHNAGRSRKALEAGCGSSAAVAVRTGRLLTVANCGTTKAVLDLGSCAYECTSDHRIRDNEAEDDRLAAIGACIARLRLDGTGPAAPGEAGCGPMRLWPGGWTMSRAIQEVDCSPLVMPHPSIQQVWLPLRASRLILGTDSVFNAFDTFHKAAGVLRDVSLTNAAAALLRCSQQHKRHRHDFVDASVLVVDFVPDNCPPFKSQLQLDRFSRNSSCSSGAAARPAGSSPSAGLLQRLISRNGSRSSRGNPDAPSHCQGQQQQSQAFRRVSSSTTVSSAGQAGLVTVHVVSVDEARTSSPASAHGQWPQKLSTAGVLLRPEQHQASSVSLLQRVGCLMCMLPPPRTCPHQGQQQQQQCLQSTSMSGLTMNGSQVTRCSLGMPTATGIPVTDSSSSSSRDSSSVHKPRLNGLPGGMSGLPRNSTLGGYPASRRSSNKPGIQHLQPLPDPAASIRFVASVDSWRAYAGSYLDLRQQLAALDMSLGAADGWSNGQPQQRPAQINIQPVRSSAAAAAAEAPVTVGSAPVGSWPSHLVVSDHILKQDQSRTVQPQLASHKKVSMGPAVCHDVAPLILPCPCLCDNGSWCQGQ